jgi:hypothetical protein
VAGNAGYLFCFFVRGLCVGKKWNEYGVIGCPSFGMIIFET